jgi:glycosyltransferase involved in cell wall biosynthesis
MSAGRILIAGYYATGSGYPNGRVTQERLEHAGRSVLDLGVAMPAETRLWRTAQGSTLGLLKGAFAFIGHNLLSAARVLRQAKATDRVYVRYPGVFFMLFLSFVPARWRPRCYLEAFISIWDAAFVDRARNKGLRRFLGPLVRAIEGRAMRAAEVVIVDTEMNARFVKRHFRVDPSRVRAIPLGVDEAVWESAVAAVSPAFTVLFVGTFVPLHGIGAITSAIAEIGSHHGIRFSFIGDGQEGARLQAFIDAHPDIDIQWRREWMSPRELAACVREADICLGVFGGQGKASRVLPYKLYMYLCLGKAFITQADLSTPEGVPRPPAEYVGDSASQTLAQAIVKLKDSPEDRVRLEEEARHFYASHLSNAKLDDAWSGMLTGNEGSARR